MCIVDRPPSLVNRESWPVAARFSFIERGMSQLSEHRSRLTYDISDCPQAPMFTVFKGLHFPFDGRVTLNINVRPPIRTCYLDHMHGVTCMVVRRSKQAGAAKRLLTYANKDCTFTCTAKLVATVAPSPHLVGHQILS